MAKNGDTKGGTIATVGKTVWRFWNTAGGMNKFWMIVGAVVVVAFIWNPWKNNQPTVANETKAGSGIAISGSNGGIINQGSGQVQSVISGSNSTVNQAGRDLTINNGASTEQQKAMAHQAALDVLQEYMLRVKEEKGPALAQRFPMGYVLFTATESRLIVPLRGEIEKHIIFHWEKGYSLIMKPDSIGITLPDATINIPPVSNMTVNGNTFWMPRVPGGTCDFWGFNNLVLQAVVVTTNEESVTVAVGFSKSR